MKILITGVINVDFSHELLSELSNTEGLEVYYYNITATAQVVKKCTPESIDALKQQPKFRYNNKFVVLYRFIQNILKLKKAVRKGNFDVVHIFFVHYLFYWIIVALRKNSKKLVITVFGSDFYRAGKYSRRLKYHILKKADIITTTNPNTGRDVMNYYKQIPADKLRIVRFGNHNLDIIDRLYEQNKGVELKKQFGIPDGKTIVMCGYSGNRVHRHSEILQQIKTMHEEEKSKLFLLFPLTYGKQRFEIAREIATLASDSGLDYKIFDNYLEKKQTAALRVITDILITVPKSDQLSRTLKENIYAGNLVITGSWLPYAILDDAGVDYHKIDSIPQLPGLLRQIIKNPAQFTVNKTKNSEIIRNDSQWSEKIKGWSALYELKK